MSYDARQQAFPTAAAAGGAPVVVLFERDDTIAVPLISRLGAAGYEVRVARTPVDLFDVAQRHPVALILIDLGIAAAGRREFWVALDGQRRGNATQVMTLRVATEEPLPDADRDLAAYTAVDVVLRDPTDLDAVIDGVRQRVPLRGGRPAGAARAPAGSSLPGVPAPSTGAWIAPAPLDGGAPPSRLTDLPTERPASWPASWPPGAPGPVAPPGPTRASAAAAGRQSPFAHPGSANPFAAPEPASPFDLPDAGNPFAAPEPAHAGAGQRPPIPPSPAASGGYASPATPSAPWDGRAGASPVRPAGQLSARDALRQMLGETPAQPGVPGSVLDAWVPPGGPPATPPPPDASAREAFLRDVLARGLPSATDETAPVGAHFGDLAGVEGDAEDGTLGSVLVEGALLSPHALEALRGVQRMLASVGMPVKLGELALLFKFLSPDQLLAALLVSRALVTPQQIAALGRIKQELANSGMDYDLETLLVMFHILPAEQLRELRGELG